MLATAMFAGGSVRRFRTGVVVRMCRHHRGMVMVALGHGHHAVRWWGRLIAGGRRERDHTLHLAKHEYEHQETSGERHGPTARLSLATLWAPCSKVNLGAGDSFIYGFRNLAATLNRTSQPLVFAAWRD